MNDDLGYDTTIPDGLEPYGENETIYRAIPYPYWRDKRDDSKVTHAAFIRRIERDKRGLSINPTEQYCRNNPLFTNPIYGVMQLVTCEIRNIKQDNGESLEVIPDRPDHGNIKRVPPSDEEHRTESLRIARELRDLANSKPILP